MLSQTQKLRARFKESIRQRHIKELMQVTRASYLNLNCGSRIFIELNQQVQQAASEKICMVLVNRLLGLLDSECEHENTYILIGNYLIDHPGACMYFIMQLLGLSEIGRKKSNYTWVLMLILLKSETLEEKMLQEFDDTIADIIQGAQNQEQLRRGLGILKFILGLENIQKREKCFPKRSLTALNKKIESIEVANLQHDIKYLLVEIGYYIGENELESQFLYQIFKGFIAMTTLAISEFPAFRHLALNSVKQISLNHPYQLQDLMKSQRKQGRNLFFEIFYIMKGCRAHRVLILQIFQYILSQFELNSVVNLLNEGIHINLVETFMDSPTPDEVYFYLKIIYLLLSRLKEKHEDSLVEQVLNSMESCGFDTFLQDIANQRHDQNIEKVLSELLDDFYSQDI